jgi:hypothetical protein
MDDVAIDQHVPNLDNALVEGDPVRCNGGRLTTSAEDLIVDDPDLLDRPGVAEVDVRGLSVAASAEVSEISLHVDIKGVAVNDHVAVQAAAADGPHGAPKTKPLPPFWLKVLFKMRMVSIAVDCCR